MRPRILVWAFVPALGCSEDKGTSVDSVPCVEYSGATEVLYADADGDGFGDEDQAFESCDAPKHAVAVAGDCNDDDASVWPGAMETWYDGADGDCNGGSDYDADEDGHDSSQFDGEDCDDTDSTTWTNGATTVELGASPACGTMVVGALLYGEAAGDEAGYDVSGEGDVNGDGYDDLLVSSLDTVYEGVELGATYLVLGPVPVGELDLVDAYARVLGPEGVRTSRGLVGPSDFDGDGYDDMGQVTSDVDRDAFTFYNFPGPFSGSLDYTAADGIWGFATDSAFWSSEAGDVDGDGLQDALIGICDPTSVTRCGAALILGPLTGDHSLDEATAHLFDNAGYWYSCEDGADGDIDTNGDGFGDVAIACRSWGVGLFEGPIEGDNAVLDADALVAMYAEEVRGAGDTNGDGYDDVLMSRADPDMYVDDDVGLGEVALVLGPVESGNVSDIASASWEGVDAGNYAKVQEGGVDIDASGTTDIVVQYSYNESSSNPYGRAVGIALTPVSGRHTIDDLHWVVDDGGSDVNYLSLTYSAGDINLDGYGDLAISAINSSVHADADGAVWLLFGGTLDNH